MSAALDKLAADVAALDTVVDSAVSLLKGIAQQVKDTAGNEEAALKLAADIEAKTAALSEAVAENTPAA